MENWDMESPSLGNDLKESSTIDISLGDKDSNVLETSKT
jgi:hypothetical protein